MSAVDAENIKQQWQTDGYCVVRSLIAPAQAQQLLAIVDRVRAQWLKASAENGKAGNPDGHNMRHVNHPAYFRDHPEQFVALMDLVADPDILDFARHILDAEPLFRATTLWFEPATAHADGSWHRDVQFMHPAEDVQRRMIADVTANSGVQLQIALVETADNEYVPGSHLRWDTDDEYYIRLADDQAHSRANDMPNAVRIHQAPGDALAFNALGLHRGRYHTDKQRRTIMLTYSTEQSRLFDYFTDQPWLVESPMMELLSPATAAFFERFTDLYADDLRQRSKVAAEFRA